jgi:hypothetical protein
MPQQARLMRSLGETVAALAICGKANAEAVAAAVFRKLRRDDSAELNNGMFVSFFVRLTSFKMRTNNR